MLEQSWGSSRVMATRRSASDSSGPLAIAPIAPIGPAARLAAACSSASSWARRAATWSGCVANSGARAPIHPLKSRWNQGAASGAGWRRTAPRLVLRR